MKTTLDINDALLRDAKALAARQGLTLTRVIEQGLQIRLRATVPARKAVRIPVFRGKGGLATGVDARSNKSMLDAADHDA